MWGGGGFSDNPNLEVSKIYNLLHITIFFGTTNTFFNRIFTIFSSLMKKKKSWNELYLYKGVHLLKLCSN